MNKNQLLIPSLRFKGFDGEWINDKLLNMSLCINNLRFPLSSQQRKDKKGIYPYFGATGVIDYINDYKIDDKILMLAEDCGNYNKFKTDPIAYYYEGKCWVNNHTHVLKSDGKNSLKYILYSIIHKDITKHLNGDSRPKLNKSELYKIDIVVTKNILEQQKIAQFFSLLDKQIELWERKVQLWEQIYKYYLNKMFANNNKIPSLRFKGFDDELINKKIKEFGNIICGKTPSTNENKFWNGDIPFITPTDINYKYIEHTSRYITNLGSKHSKLIPLNSILVTCVASIGKNAINKLESCFNQQINAIVPNNNYDYEFLYYLMDKNVDLINENSSKSATQMINKINFENLEIFIPIQLEEQQKIASFFDKINQLREKTKQIIMNLNNQKKYYLKNMFV